MFPSCSVGSGSYNPRRTRQPPLGLLDLAESSVQVPYIRHQHLVSSIQSVFPLRPFQLKCQEIISVRDSQGERSSSPSTTVYALCTAQPHGMACSWIRCNRYGSCHPTSSCAPEASLAIVEELCVKQLLPPGQNLLHSHPTGAHILVPILPCRVLFPEV